MKLLYIKYLFNPVIVIQIDCLSLAIFICDLVRLVIGEVNKGSSIAK